MKSLFLNFICCEIAVTDVTVIILIMYCIVLFSRRVFALRLLDIFLELTIRRADMSQSEREAFRILPDYHLLESILHYTLQYV